MKLAKVLSLLGAGALLVATVYAALAGNFFTEANAAFAYPVAQAVLVDLYLGFALFSGWIIYREKSWWRIGVLLVVFCFVGNLLACLYLFWALHTSAGDWRKFWMGARAV